MRKYLCIAIIILSLTSACKKNPPIPKPVTCASVSANSAAVGQGLKFASCTKGVANYLWNFGDSTTATNDTVYHTYYLPGTYTVTFTSSNSSGKGSTDTFIITISALESWTFKGVNYYAPYVDSYNNGFDVSFQANSVTPNSNNSSFFQVATGGNTFPPLSGTDTVESFPSHPSEAIVGLRIGNYGYHSSSGSIGNQTIQVSVSQNRVINIVGSGIMLQNSNNPSDSAPISFNISQAF